MSLMDSSVDWTWKRKKSVSLKICKWKLPKLKFKELQKETEHNIQAWKDNFKRFSINVIEMPGEEKKIQVIYLKQQQVQISQN